MCTARNCPAVRAEAMRQARPCWCISGKLRAQVRNDACEPVFRAFEASLAIVP